MSGSSVDCTDKTCTCGEGPWDLRGRCETCGGFDLGMPYLDPPTGITLQQQLDGSVKAWLPKRGQR